MAIHDLVIRGGNIVTTSHCEVGDVAISDGRIVSLGGHPRGHSAINASGMLVVPGGIDGHVHFTSLPDPGRPVRPDDFRSGSRAAAMGGITTVGNMTHQAIWGGLLDSLEATRRLGESESAVDFVLHPVLNDPNSNALQEIGGLPQFGYRTLKIFMVFAGFEEKADAYLEAMDLARAVGVLVLIHCEDAVVVRFAQQRLRRLGMNGVRNYPLSRPVEAEVAAVERAIALTEVTGARSLVVHLASARALARCVEAHRRGVQIHVETRPLYLHLTDRVFETEPEPERFVGNPPPRSAEDQNSLWLSLASGEIDTIASDHAPWTIEQKLMFDNVENVLPGVADLETMLPMLFSEGVNKGRLSVNRFVEISATTPAELYGISEKKGAIEIGRDADIVLWDPGAEWTVDGGIMESRAGYSPYDGWRVQGKPAFVISRGEVIRDPDGLADDITGRGLLATSRPPSQGNTSSTADGPGGQPTRT